VSFLLKSVFVPLIVLFFGQTFLPDFRILGITKTPKK